MTKNVHKNTSKSILTVSSVEGQRLQKTIEYLFEHRVRDV